jgi:acetolactate synthase-1/2/3 large subunit
MFGLPGTQNVALFEGLRRSPIRAVVPTSELAAGFMANGYYRASGRPGVLTTIPGPGFAYTVPAIAEAAHDSAAVLYIAGKPLARGNVFDLQVIDQPAILRSLVKHIFEVDKLSDLAAAAEEAYYCTTSGEPGPVLLHISDHVMREAGPECVQSSVPSQPLVDESALHAAILRIRQARRIAILAGQGTNTAASLLQEFAERRHAVVLTNRSGRGAVPEDHPLALSFRDEHAIDNVSSVLAAADLVIVIGCKLTHNGSYEFQLRLQRDKLIRVDTSEEVLRANYPASVALCADSSWFLSRVINEIDEVRHNEGWTRADLEHFKTRGRPGSSAIEPRILGIEPANASTFFSLLRRAMPREACLVTDTGLHQALASRHFQALASRTFIIPSDFQSMGFGIPAAIAAKLARPERPVVAIVGDGGFAISGLELLTAVRERIPLCVIIFKDGALGQIRLQQMSSFGHVYGTNLITPNLDLFARSIGAQHFELNGLAEDTLRKAIHTDQVTLIEVNVRDSSRMRLVQAKGLVRGTVRQLAGPAAVGWLKNKLS